MVQGRFVEEDALRKAYNERMQSLGQKLKEPPPNRVGQQFRVHGGEGTSMLGDVLGADEGPIEALIQHIRDLCQERRGIRREIENSGQRHQAVIHDLKSQLSFAQQQHADMRLEQARLRELMSSVEGPPSARETQQNCKAEAIRCLELEVERLETVCRHASERTTAIQAEVRDSQLRISELSRERSAAQEEAASTAQKNGIARAELDTLRQRLQQCEAERQELEQKYRLVGARFGRVMEVSEKKTRETLHSLQAEAHSTRKKADKQKKRAEDIKARIAAAEASVAHQTQVLSDRDKQMERLRDECQLARERALQQDEIFFDAQRQAMYGHISDLQKLGNMMPMAAHQQILEQQGELFCTATRELEVALRQQAKSHREALMTQQEARNFQLEVEAFRQRELGDRRAVLDADFAQDHAINRCLHLEQTLLSLRASMEAANVAIRGAEHQRSTLAASLEKVTSKMGGLRAVLDRERQTKALADEGLADAQRRLTALSRAVADSQVHFGSEFALCRDVGKIESSLQCRRQDRAALEDALSHLRDRRVYIATQVSDLRVQCKDRAQWLGDADRRVAEFDQKQAVNARASRARREATCRMQCAITGHADMLRRAMMELRSKLRDEQHNLVRDAHQWLQQWHAASSCHAWGASMLQRPFEPLCAANKTNDTLEVRLAEVLDGMTGLQQSLAGAVETISIEQFAVEKQGRKAQTARSNLSTLAAGLSSTVVDAGCEDLGRAFNRVGTFSAGVEGEELAAVSDISQNEFLKLEQGMIHDLQAVRAAAARAENSRLWSLLSKRLLDAKQRDSQLLAGVLGERSASDAAVQRLEAKLKALRDQEAAGRDDEKAMKAQEDECTAVTGRLVAVEAEFGSVAANVKRSRALLEERSIAASNAELSAQEEVRDTLVKELEDASSFFLALQGQLHSEVSRRQAEWERHLEKLGQGHLVARRRDEAILRAEMHRLAQELSSQERTKESMVQSRETSMSICQDELSTSIAAMDQIESKLRRFEVMCESCSRGARQYDEALQSVERRLSEVAHQRRADAEEAEKEERELVRLHAQAMDRLRRQRDAEVTHLEAVMHQSLSSLSVDLSANSEAALRVHSELNESAERLAERARWQLNVVGEALGANAPRQGINEVSPVGKTGGAGRV